MAVSILRLMRLILREALRGGGLERCPEPSPVMIGLQNVESFHDQGAERGALVPVYHFNALAISSLLPYGGMLVDLGSGSGQFLSHFARCRTDSRIIGLELSEGMVNVGNRALREAGLSTSVRLDLGDMTQFSDRVSEKVDVVSSIFSFHHLPSSDSLSRCLDEVRKVRERWGCGVWIFDHCRPRAMETAEVFPELFTPQASESFRRDSRNSLLASFSFRELSELIEADSMGKFSHECSRLLRLYQIHWLKAEDGKRYDRLPLSSEVTLRPEELRAFEQLKMLFKRKPF